MKFSKLVVLYFFLQIASLLIGTYGQCPWKDHLPSVQNGYRSNVANLKLYSNDLAYGYYDIGCNPGYSLNPDIGGRITCLDSGNWSQPLPQCKSMGTCLISDLFNFIQTADGIQIAPSMSFIYTNGIDDKRALGGSNITLQCLDGYTNIGGALMIICTVNNTWTPFPNCTSTSTSTTIASPLRCAVTSDTWKFNNGFISNPNNVLLYSDNTATGSITVSCAPGYVIDTISQGVFMCNNGHWSSRPYCTKTPRCPLAPLKTFLSMVASSRGLQISSQLVSENPDEVGLALVGSYILFTCTSSYNYVDGNLNVICGVDGQWSQFPSCVGKSTPMASDG